MHRRTLLFGLFASPLLLGASAGRELSPARIATVQESPVAGFQYHQGQEVWHRLRQGDALQLVREPHNRYDCRAVAIHWRGCKLGYLPRVENTAVSQMLDRGQRLAASIARLQASPDPWRRIRVRITLQLDS